jgi:hypothetical protein
LLPVSFLEWRLASVEGFPDDVPDLVEGIELTVGDAVLGHRDGVAVSA